MDHAAVIATSDWDSQLIVINWRGHAAATRLRTRLLSCSNSSSNANTRKTAQNARDGAQAAPDRYADPRSSGLFQSYSPNALSKNAIKQLAAVHPDEERVLNQLWQAIRVEGRVESNASVSASSSTTSPLLIKIPAPCVPPPLEPGLGSQGLFPHLLSNSRTQTIKTPDPPNITLSYSVIATVKLFENVLPSRQTLRGRPLLYLPNTHSCQSPKRHLVPRLRTSPRTHLHRPLDSLLLNRPTPAPTPKASPTSLLGFIFPNPLLRLRLLNSLTTNGTAPATPSTSKL
ncbi:hypothetical protein BC830DRAFT_1153088 [Chytriomyces sp. MP71]|nr:hypothetical protein BC830DRAFT_1153088 [Chytriomyces sp. MP71]